ncbi:MAG: glycosyltransferase family 2 protein [Planctomycetota bacterium]|nr:glycosyltransferase family 2 protein [Planctomycetota bacterium]
MKLIVQIPCYNEAETLEATLEDLPRDLPGIDAVEVLVIDDGSTDATVFVARDGNVDYVVSHSRNRGLACAFRTGLQTAIERGADIIVNTDGDAQYVGEDIADLIAPLLDRRADIVVGDRRTWNLARFSLGKRLLQAFGSWVVRRLSGADVRDAACGFRAFTREAATRLNLVTDFSHCMETVVQASAKGLRIVSVPIRTRATQRESRLFRSTSAYLFHSAAAILKTFCMYKPLRLVLLASGPLFLLGTAPIIRFLFLYARDGSAGHIQSLILGAGVVVLACLMLMFGLLAELIAYNRQLIESLIDQTKRRDSEPQREFAIRDEQFARLIDR